MISLEIRELRQRANELLRLVELGEIIEITDLGRPVAHLTPVLHSSPLETMPAALDIETASADLDDLPEPLIRPDGFEAPSAVLERLRRDEH
jgi:prevent-host-death family protein